MEKRERILSPEMLARLAKIQAAINAEADKFRNPETFMAALESTLARTAEDSGGIASLDYKPQSKMYKLWFANQRLLIFWKTSKGYFCSLREYTANGGHDWVLAPPLELDNDLVMQAFNLVETKYKQRNQININLFNNNRESI
jgi:hypothetical protein